MTEDDLRREAAAKRDDTRYPPAMRSWLRDMLIAVYAKRLPGDRVVDIVREVWPVTP